MANFNLNKVILGGRLTSNPELRQTASGVMVLTFGIAVNRRYTSKNEDGTTGQPQADFLIAVLGCFELFKHILPPYSCK